MFNGIYEMCLGTKEKRKTILWVVIILVAAMLVLMIFNSMFSAGPAANFSRLSDWADFTKYQAVFLSNGQVYFGKVMDANSQTLVLEDIYYLRSAQNLQTSNSTTTDKTTEADNFSLVKLGGEIHGPEDRMSINLSQVLFVEDLKYDSKVVEAIRAYETKK